MMLHAEDRRYQDVNDSKIDVIDSMMYNAVKNGDKYVFLNFHQFGYEWSDVKFLQDEFGYDVSRNGACLWWEVRWD